MSPHDSSCIELATNPWHHVRDVKDEAGRPLGEHAASDVARSGVAFELVACPYHDSRRGSAMNQSALRAMTDQWSETVAYMVHLSALFRRRRAPADGPLDVLDLWRLSVLALCLPAFLARRSDDSARRPIALPVAGLYKAGQGVFGVCCLLLLMRRDWRSTCTVGDFMHHSDQLRLMHDPVSQRVCAAPIRLVRQFVEAALEPAAGPVRADDGVRAADERLIRYADVVAHIELMKMAYFAWTRLLQLALREVLEPYEPRLDVESFLRDYAVLLLQHVQQPELLGLLDRLLAQLAERFETDAASAAAYAALSAPIDLPRAATGARGVLEAALDRLEAVAAPVSAQLHALQRAAHESLGLAPPTAEIAIEDMPNLGAVRALLRRALAERA